MLLYLTKCVYFAKVFAKSCFFPSPGKFSTHFKFGA